jgi:hypothetical protein
VADERGIRTVVTTKKDLGWGVGRESNRSRVMDLTRGGCSNPGGADGTSRRALWVRCCLFRSGAWDEVERSKFWLLLWLVAILAMVVPGALAEPYVSLSGGGTWARYGSTEHDHNPNGMGYDELRFGGAVRVAGGWAWKYLGVEVGYAPLLGRYNRAIACNGKDCETEHQHDTVGEQVRTAAVDLRGVIRSPQWRGLHAYGFLGGALVEYDCARWIHNNGHDGVWVNEEGNTLQTTAGFGVEYALGERYGVFVEYQRYFGEFMSNSAFVGVRYSFR